MYQKYGQAIKSWYKKDKKLLGFCLGAGLVFTLVFGFCTKSYSDSVQEDIAQSVIRYHVLANSDSAEDQALKLQVKDGVLAAFEQELTGCKTIEETRDFLSGHLADIENKAQEIVWGSGYDYPVSVSLSRDFFPTKVYGDASFPSGIYEALRIEIGQSAGRNWWCVMFPPLCFVDATRSELPEQAKDELKEALDPEAYELVMSANSEDQIPVKIKFKVVEWWQNRKLSDDFEKILVKIAE